MLPALVATISFFDQGLALDYNLDEGSFGRIGGRAGAPPTAIGFAAVVGPVPAPPTRLIWAMPQHIIHFQRHCAEHERDILRDNF